MNNEQVGDTMTNCGNGNKFSNNMTVLQFKAVTGNNEYFWGIG